MGDASALPHNIDLILTLAVGLATALAFGYLTHRLGWSPIVGYLAAGILLGPHTPGFVANRALAEQLAEVGVILLMFGVGMHFHLKDLLAVRGIAVAGAVVQSAVATGLGAWAFHAMGASWTSGVVMGLALSVASTVVLIRVLSDSGQLGSPTGRIAVGWLVMEDIFTVFVLVLLPVALAANSETGLGAAFGIAALKVAAFGAIVLYGGARLAPWLLTRIADTRSRELFTLAVLAIALGVAVASSVLFGVSMALGAFLAGMVVGQSQFSARAASDALPLRDAFAVMFFLSVGMLFDPAGTLATPLLTLVTIAIVMVGKPVAAIGIVALLGYSSRVGFGVALALAQIGEFSFLLATLGRQLGALDGAALNALVAAAILSILVNPMLYRLVDPLERALASSPALWRWMNRRAGNRTEAGAQEADGPSRHAVIVGYGPIGRMLSGLLADHGIPTVIIELNAETYRALAAESQPVVYGDATSAVVLEQAGIARAASLILSASGSGALRDALRIARELNPEIHIVVRADYLAEVDSLRRAGADEVFSGEGAVAQALAESVLRGRFLPPLK